MVVLMCCGGLLILAAVKIAAQHYPLVAMVVVGTGYAARRVVHTIRARRTARRLGIEGWRPAPIDQPWPWLPLSERPDQIRVHRAWARTVDRLPLTVGEITWNGNALHGSVPDWQGRGVFVVVQLPVPVEPMALRRPHRMIGTARRLDAPGVARRVRGQPDSTMDGRPRPPLHFPRDTRTDAAR
ncbi:hypothetical protein [Plantactinospora sp. B5E13]|uniref:hypothetical protein n=1 Tax=Plantactinospora sp. B5E13 TaxID=3153758 RepID=UPI00325C8BD2